MANGNHHQTSDVTNALCAFGLSEVEVSVYQAALSLGARPASVIAQRAGLKRGHTYNVLRSLMEKGIVQEYVKNSVRHFTCSAPKSLLSMVELRESELAKQRDQLQRIIPELEKLRNPLSAEPKVKFFRGLEGIKEIYEEMLRVPNQEIYAVVDAQYSWTNYGGEPEEWLKSFIRRRADRNIWWRGIVNRSEASDRAVQNRSAIKREVRSIEGLDLRVEISIFGSKVALLSTAEDMVGVLIEHEGIAETARSLHQTVWKFLPAYDSAGEPAIGGAGLGIPGLTIQSVRDLVEEEELITPKVHGSNGTGAANGVAFGSKIGSL